MQNICCFCTVHPQKSNLPATNFIGSLIYNFCYWIYTEENIYINTVYMGSSLEFLLIVYFGPVSSFKWKK
jgi:hypothetical protein